MPNSSYKEESDGIFNEVNQVPFLAEGSPISIISLRFVELLLIDDILKVRVNLLLLVSSSLSMVDVSFDEVD